jgi:hypothetical protein
LYAYGLMSTHHLFPLRAGKSWPEPDRTLGRCGLGEQSATLSHGEHRDCGIFHRRWDALLSAALLRECETISARARETHKGQFPKWPKKYACNHGIASAHIPDHCCCDDRSSRFGI